MSLTAPNGKEVSLLFAPNGKKVSKLWSPDGSLVYQAPAAPVTPTGQTVTLMCTLDNGSSTGFRRGRGATHTPASFTRKGVAYRIQFMNWGSIGTTEQYYFRKADGTAHSATDSQNLGGMTMTINGLTIDFPDELGSINALNFGVTTIPSEDISGTFSRPSVGGTIEVTMTWDD